MGILVSCSYCSGTGLCDSGRVTCPQCNGRGSKVPATPSSGKITKADGGCCLIVIFRIIGLYINSYFGVYGSAIYGALLVGWADWRFFGRGSRIEDEQPWGWALVFWLGCAYIGYDSFGWIGAVPIVVLGLAHAKWRG